ncbi:MAG: hypothetical protein AAFZ15_30050 [Bacteroidota bacterium]
MKTGKTIAFLFSCSILMMLFSFQFDNWKQCANHADAWGYYVYLPSVFIYHDLSKLDSAVAVRKRYNPGSVGETAGHPYGLVELHTTQLGKVGNKYTSGVALLQLPFFALAHLTSSLLEFPADGLSEPYMFALLMSAIFYPLLGLFFLVKTLRKYFMEKTIWIVAAALVLGTNLFYFSSMNFMSHAYLFGLYCLLIYVTDQWYSSNTEQWKLLATAGLLTGWIAVIRPNEFIAFLIPALWGVASFSDLKNRVSLFLRNWKVVLLATGLFFVPWLPQFIYWQWISGEWLHYSYPGEGFDFTNSKIWYGLTSYKNGWLVWTPMMLLALAGLFILPAYTKKPMTATVVFLSIHVVVIYAWWAWWYPNGFGSRPMVETYALLAFPFCAFVEQLYRIKLGRWIVIPLIGFLIFLNLFQTWQWGKGIFWTQHMNQAAYWSIFLKTECTKEFLTALDCKIVRPPSSVQFDKLLLEEDFEKVENENTSGGVAKSGKKSFYLKERKSPVYTIEAKGHKLRAGDWLRVSAEVFVPFAQKTCTGPESSFLTVDIIGPKKSTRHIRLQNKIGRPMTWFHCGETEKWEDAFFFLKIPSGFSDSGRLEVYVKKHDRATKSLFIDDLRVELWR